MKMILLKKFSIFLVFDEERILKLICNENFEIFMIENIFGDLFYCDNG